MHALDRRKLSYPSRGKPVEEFHGGARIGAARVRRLIALSQVRLNVVSNPG